MFKSFMWLVVNRTDVTVILVLLLTFVFCPCSSITEEIV